MPVSYCQSSESQIKADGTNLLFSLHGIWLHVMLAVSEPPSNKCKLLHALAARSTLCKVMKITASKYRAMTQGKFKLRQTGLVATSRCVSIEQTSTSL